MLQFEKLLNPQGRTLGIEETVVENVEMDSDLGYGQVDTADDEMEHLERTVEAPRSSIINVGKKPSRKDETLDLLKEQCKLQEEHNKESRKILTDIKNNLKESVRFQRKRFQIEEEQHEMLKEKYKNEADRELVSKIKKRKLEVIESQLASLKNQ